MSLDRPQSIQIKGIKEGLLVTLGEGDWPNLQETLLAYIIENESFFNGAKVALEVGNHVLHAAELGSLRDKLSDKGISLWAILSNSPLTEQTSQMLGLATRLSVPKPERSIKSFDTSLEGENAVLVQRTLRSGFSVNYSGHVVVIGDVNPGAEIKAGGSIVVWGRLRGVVHAGVDGNEKAIVCALDLEPTQLRIANYISVAPKRKEKPVPEIAYVHNEQVIAEHWSAKEGGK